MQTDKEHSRNENNEDKSIVDAFDECYVNTAEARKDMVLVKRKGAGKILEPNETRFRDL